MTHKIEMTLCSIHTVLGVGAIPYLQCDDLLYMQFDSDRCLHAFGNKMQLELSTLNMIFSSSTTLLNC